MPKRYQNKKHLRWIHSQGCILLSNKDCFGPIQAHHLLKPWEGVRGAGLKATDKNVVPLCLRHHIMLHKRGNELAFFNEQTGNPDHGRAIAQQCWLESPYKDDDN